MTDPVYLQHHGNSGCLACSAWLAATSTTGVTACLAVLIAPAVLLPCNDPQMHPQWTPLHPVAQLQTSLRFFYAGCFEATLALRLPPEPSAEALLPQRPYPARTAAVA